jgi:hypothetical protein
LGGQSPTPLTVRARPGTPSPAQSYARRGSTMCHSGVVGSRPLCSSNDRAGVLCERQGSAGSGGGDPDAALHTRGLVGDNQARRRLHTATVSERSGGRALDHGSPPMAHRQYSLEILEYSRGQLPHHRRQTKQDQHPDQSRPYIQPALKLNSSVHQPIRPLDAAILGKPGTAGRISLVSDRVRAASIKSEHLPKVVSQRRRAGKGAAATVGGSFATPLLSQAWTAGRMPNPF